jgi:hypothetical protein
VGYANIPITKPCDLNGTSNGKLPASLLTPIPVPSGGRLHHLAARSWTAMVNHAAVDGVRFRGISTGDCYRSYDAQVTLFQQRYVPGPGPGQKTWNGVVYHLKTGMAPAAVPGTSNHGDGLAIDACALDAAGKIVALDPSPGTTIGRRAYQWLMDHYVAYGWSHEYTDPKSEPWHLHYWIGDKVPPALGYSPPPTNSSEETDMLILDFAPGAPNWTRLLSTGTETTWIQRGGAAAILDRAGTKAVAVFDRGELLQWIQSTKCVGPRPWTFDSDPDLVAAWSASGGG